MCNNKLREQPKVKLHIPNNSANKNCVSPNDNSMRVSNGIDVLHTNLPCHRKFSFIFASLTVNHCILRQLRKYFESQPNCLLPKIKTRQLTNRKNICCFHIFIWILATHPGFARVHCRYFHVFFFLFPWYGYPGPIYDNKFFSYFIFHTSSRIHTLYCSFFHSLPRRGWDSPSRRSSFILTLIVIY
jgi:hypothetical protein